MLRAIKRFDPTVSTPFWAYASWWVRQAMQELVSQLAGPTVLSDRAHRALARVREARRALGQELEREPSSAELAAASGLGREQVESILAAERAPRALSELQQSVSGRTCSLASCSRIRSYRIARSRSQTREPLELPDKAWFNVHELLSAARVLGYEHRDIAVLFQVFSERVAAPADGERPAA